MTEPEPERPHETRTALGDVALSAALIAAGESLLGAEWRGGRRCYFVFARGARLDALLIGWAAGTLAVPARPMADAARGLRELIAAGPPAEKAG